MRNHWQWDGTFLIKAIETPAFAAGLGVASFRILMHSVSKNGILYQINAPAVHCLIGLPISFEFNSKV
jgi:hypothetical protein